jgi:phosphatidylserine/phosphatidylglycerophosphate/cardiolipin synthase-like enzyme
MLDNGITVASLFQEFLTDPEERREIEQELTNFPSNKRKLQIIQKIITYSGKYITSNNYDQYGNWLDRVIDKIHSLPSKNSANNAFFSHHDNIRDFVIKILKSAQKDLKICMFTISDDPIAETVAGCHKMGIQVRVITDDGKIFDKGSDIYSLDRTGVKIKIDSFRSLMHHKFVIIDNQKLLTGSYNWTRTGSDVNNENVLLTTNGNIVRAYRKEFKRLWKGMKPLPH